MRALLARPAALWAVPVLLAVALNAVFLGSGFAADDLVILPLLREDPLPYARWRGPWSLWDVPAFTTLWWRDADAGGAFWRPLPGLVLEGSVRLFGEVAFPLHLASVALHAVNGALLALLVRRLGAAHGVGLAAGAIWVACEDHAMNVGWIATITDLLCAAGMLLALHAWVGWLRGRRPLAMAGALAGLVVALGSKESGAVAPIALLWLGVLMPHGVVPARVDPRPFLRDPASWAPPLALLSAWLATYVGLDLGGTRSLFYVDPFATPGAFLANLVPHLPVMALATLTPVPPSLAMFEPATLLPLAVAGLAVVAAFAWVAPRGPLALWGAGLWLAALLPQMGTDASERLLYVPFLGAAVVLAVALAAPPPGLRGRLARWWSGGLLAASIAMYALLAPSFVPSLQQAERHARTLAPHVDGRPVLVLNAASPFVTFYLRDALAWVRGAPVDLRVLSAGNGVWSVERAGDAAFVLRTDRRGWLDQPFARIVRTGPIRARYPGELFDATVLETAGGDARAVRFDLHVAPDAVLLAAWDGDGFVPVDLAALAPGERQVLADTSDVWASLAE